MFDFSAIAAAQAAAARAASVNKALYEISEQVAKAKAIAVEGNIDPTFYANLVSAVVSIPSRYSSVGNFTAQAEAAKKSILMFQNAAPYFKASIALEKRIKVELEEGTPSPVFDTMLSELENVYKNALSLGVNEIEIKDQNLKVGNAIKAAKTTRITEEIVLAKVVADLEAAKLAQQKETARIEEEKALEEANRIAAQKAAYDAKVLAEAQKRKEEEAAKLAAIAQEAKLQEERAKEEALKAAVYKTTVDETANKPDWVEPTKAPVQPVQAKSKAPMIAAAVGAAALYFITKE